MTTEKEIEDNVCVYCKKEKCNKYVDACDRCVTESKRYGCSVEELEFIRPKYNVDKWLRYEDDMIKYYYPQIRNWIDGGIQKPAGIYFTAGMARVIGMLIEEAIQQGRKQLAEEITHMLTPEKLSLDKELMRKDLALRAILVLEKLQEESK